jgi:hypothetical protein
MRWQHAGAVVFLFPSVLAEAKNGLTNTRGENMETGSIRAGYANGAANYGDNVPTQSKPVQRSLERLQEEIERVGRHVEMLEQALEVVLRPEVKRDAAPRMSAPSNEPAVKLSIEIDEKSNALGAIANRALSIHERLGI